MDEEMKQRLKKTGGQGLLMMTTSGANASEFF